MDTKIQSLNTLTGGQHEEPRLQEHFQVLVEDHSIPAEKILSELKKQESAAILFVP